MKDLGKIKLLLFNLGLYKNDIVALSNLNLHVIFTRNENVAVGFRNI